MRTRLLLSTLLLALAAVLAAVIFLPSSSHNAPSSVSVAPEVANEESTPHESLMSPQAELALQTAHPAPISVARTDAVKRGTESPSSARVTVRVTAREAGRVLEGAAVVLREVDRPDLATTFIKSHSGRPGESILTGQDGVAQFVVQPHSATRVIASGAWSGTGIPPGHESAEVRALEPGEEVTINLSLPTQSDLSFFGQLIAAESGKPLAEGKVDLIRTGMDAMIDPVAHTIDPITGSSKAIPRAMTLNVEKADARPIATAVPDARGVFELDSATWTVCTARIDVPGRSMVELPIVNGHDSAGTAIPIRLSQTSAVAARLTDSGGMPLARVAVRITFQSAHKREPLGTSNYHPIEPTWQALTDLFGECRVEDLPSGVPLALQLIYDDHVDPHSDLELVLKGGEERRLDLRFGGRAGITGTLMDASGAALTDEIVWIRRADSSQRGMFSPSDKFYAQTHTNGQGRFSFDDLAAGDWWVGPAAQSMKIPSLQMARILAPVAELVHVPWIGNIDIIVRTNRGLSIRGHVLGPTGAPISSASVSATLAGTQFKQDTSSNGDGSFLLGPLVAGDYDLTASVKVFVNYSSAADADATGFAPCGPVRTKAGDQSAILTMRPGGAIRCLLNSTVAVQDLGLPSVRILDSTGALAGQVMGASCRGLQPGMYSAFVSATSGACGSKTGIVVAAGETTDATITLDKGAKLRVSREPGATRIDEYQVLSDGVRIASRRSAIDQAYEHVVPAGHIVIRKHVDPDGWSEDAIDVSAGETREIVLRP